MSKEKEVAKSEDMATPVEDKKKSKKKFPVWAKIVVGITGGIVALFVTVWGGLNIFKYAIYADFYAVKVDVCPIPGLNDGTCPQGIGYSTSKDVILVSSYAKSGSYIYVTGNGVDKTIAVPLGKDGAAFTGHVGGVSTSGDYVYLAGTKDNGTGFGGIHVLSLDGLLNYSEGLFEVGEPYSVASSASFTFTDDTYLYVGEFADPANNYVCVHDYETDEGLHTAIACKYLLSDFPYEGDRSETPVEAQAYYSIRDQIQGFGVKSDGTIVVSTSWGITNSHFYSYAPSCLKDSGSTMFAGTSYEAELYTLTNPTDNLVAPAMMEGIAMMDDKVLSFTESACNKYVFGKFFFATNIFTLAI